MLNNLYRNFYPNGKRDKAVIFDIDGTLTPCNACIFSERENASELVQAYADNGFKIIYLTARNVYFQFNIPLFYPVTISQIEIFR